MALSNKTVDFTRNQINASKQRERAVTFVLVVASCETLALLRWSIRMNIADGLNAGLFVIRDINSAVRLC